MFVCAGRAAAQRLVALARQVGNCDLRHPRRSPDQFAAIQQHDLDRQPGLPVGPPEFSSRSCAPCGCASWPISVTCLGTARGSSASRVVPAKRIAEAGVGFEMRPRPIRFQALQKDDALIGVGASASVRVTALPSQVAYSAGVLLGEIAPPFLRRAVLSQAGQTERISR